MSRVIGIDLGTTNSVVVVMEGGHAQVIPNQQGGRTTPSIVAFTGKRETLVGQIARRQALTNPQNTVFGVKRLVGRRFDSPAVKAAGRLCPYQIVEAPNGDAHVQIDDRVYSPPEIEAIVLRHLKAAAEDYLGEPVEEAIISVPAYFDDAQRQATKDAGTIAGLKVQRILNEATAASLAFGMIESRSGKVAIYDLGGGTFDVSVLEVQDGIYQVLATAGDTYLGGENFDELILRWLVEQFRKEHQIDVSGDPMALLRLREAAEKAKCELSHQPQAEIRLPFLSADRNGPKHLSTVLSRTRFERMIQAMLEHTEKLCRDALRDAGLSAEDVDEVVPVGGQTRTPAVMEMIRKVFGREPNRSVNPDEVVGIGAAIHAGMLQGEVTDLVLLDVTPHTLGIETKDGTFTPIIERNSNIPVKKGRIFTTVADHQKQVEVHVLQGEGCMARENTSLSRFTLAGLPASQGTRPTIEVRFEIDINGIVQVSATDHATGRQQNVTVRASSGLTQSEVDRARSDADRRQGVLEDPGSKRGRLTTELTQLLHSTRKTYLVMGPKLTNDERDSARRAFTRAEEARNGSLEEGQAALGALETVAEMLRRAMPRG